jgi:hypothetical protein
MFTELPEGRRPVLEVVVHLVDQAEPGRPPGVEVGARHEDDLGAGRAAQGAQVLTLAPFTADDALEFLSRRLTPARVGRERA